MRSPLPLLSLLFIFLFTLPVSEVNEDWELRKEKNGIKVYTRKTLKSKIKEVRMEFQIESPLSTIIALLNDTEAYKDWIYRFKESIILTQINDLDCIYYGAVDFPWPLADRDLVATSVTRQDPVTKVVTVTTTAISDYEYEAKEDMVRITNHENTWRFEPVGNGLVNVEYELHSDPGGSIPNWAINMALDQGSTSSMETFIKILQTEPYRSNRLPFIID